MLTFEWSEEKNQKLIGERGVSFEQCADIINNNNQLAVIKNKPPYEHQNVYVLLINNYVHYVPCIESEEKIFLKTIIPNRKGNKYYNKLP